MKVLIVDDDEFALSILRDTLARMGYDAVTATDGNAAMAILDRGDIRLMVTDWDMPGMNGLELCKATRKADLPGYVYIIMLTGREGASQRLEGLCAGADDFISKPLDPEELLVCLKTSERILALETREVALFALAKLAESRDSDTGAHVERVQLYARVLARNLCPEVRGRFGIDDEYVRLLYQTSPLHDLGKVGIPDQVLLKPGKLTPDEFAVMKTHTLIGGQTLDAALQRFPTVRFLQMARDIAISHHERFDGSGYPHGLIGEQIPFAARIVALADVYDAITSRRVYKAAESHAHAKAEILAERGRQFDPEVVDAFVASDEQFLAIRNRFSDGPQEARPQIALPAPAAQRTPAASGGTILAVDDDPAVLAQLYALLSATGETVVVAKDGIEALRLIAEHKPKVIVSDWVMPGLDGIDLCRQVRLRGDASPAHFIMLTAHGDKARLLNAYEAGVDDFVVKPFAQEELLARVRAGLRSRKLHEEALQSALGSKVLTGQLATVNSRLERLAITDELTGLFNRRHAMSRLDEQWTLAARHGRPLTVFTVDVDHFKKINDTYGHDAGDVVLRRVAAILQDECRGTDAVCRIGGEEFLVVLHSQTVQEALVCAERCRATVAAQALPVRGNLISVTVSVGVSTRDGRVADVAQLLRAADEALYAAKAGGRNCIRVASQDPGLASQERGATDGSAGASPSPLPAVGAPQAPGASAVPPIDRAAMLKRCGGDPKFAAAVIERFRKQAPVEINRLHTSLAAGDAAVVQRAAHSLKSMTAYVGCDRASSSAREIEESAQNGALAAVGPALERLGREVAEAIAWSEREDASSQSRVA